VNDRLALIASLGGDEVVACCGGTCSSECGWCRQWKVFDESLSDHGSTEGGDGEVDVVEGEDPISPCSRASHRSRASSAKDFRDVDEPEARSRFASVESELFEAAIGSTPAPWNARHPGRTSAGLVLLRRVKDHLRAGGLEHDDSSAIVERIFFDSMPDRCVVISSIEEVVRPVLLKRFLKQMAASQSSIEVTFHGTRKEHVADILERGLVPSLCTTGAYGRGAYVGTHAGVAHQYADPDACGQRHMCVVLAVVGNQLVKGHEGEQATVTAADQVQNPTQYCFVDGARLFVSHVINYTVTNVGGYRVGGGWADPFQRHLSLAVTRAAKLARKTGVL